MPIGDFEGAIGDRIHRVPQSPVRGSSLVTIRYKISDPATPDENPRRRRGLWNGVQEEVDRERSTAIRIRRRYQEPMERSEMLSDSYRLVLPVLLLGSVIGCSPGDGAGLSGDDHVPEAERFGGTAVFASFGDLQSMNPLVSSDNNSNQIQREMLFMPLVRYDETLELQPWLAERWDTVRVHPDTLELTWRIRQDVRWHDGTPTTGEDVLFTYQRLKDPRTAYPNHQRLAHYSPEARLLDPYTVVMRLQQHAEFLDVFAMTPIVPKHVLGDVPPEQLIQHGFAFSPVGNGPFRFVRRVPGQEWVFEANPDFPEALGGRPYLDRVVYREIPSMTTLLTELLTGRIDIYSGPNPNQAQAILGATGVELRTSPSRQYNYLAFNGRLPIFSDPRTRQAIAMGIDRRQIVDALIYGYGELGRATVTPTHYGFDPDAQVRYDPEGARRLLAEAGWTQGRDGILVDPQGRPLRFTIMTNAGNDVRRDIAEIIQAQLRPLGIAVQPRLVEWTSMIAQLQGAIGRNGVRERDFDAVIGGWVDWEQKDDVGILHSRSLNDPYQYVGYSNPRVDVLIDTLATLVDRDAALPLWSEYQRLIATEAPYVVLYYPERLNGVRARLRGAVFDVRGEFPSVTQWWIHPSERRIATGGEPPAGG
jgi:peptide/nickel transport system substrate-binding protein